MFAQHFDQRTQADLSDYDDFLAHTNARFAGMAAASSISSGDVAALIHTALTDGSDTLRYLIGDDARGFVKARSELTEEGYMAFMRQQFQAA